MLVFDVYADRLLRREVAADVVGRQPGRRLHHRPNDLHVSAAYFSRTDDCRRWLATSEVVEPVETAAWWKRSAATSTARTMVRTELRMSFSL